MDVRSSNLLSLLEAQSLNTTQNMAAHATGTNKASCIHIHYSQVHSNPRQ
eukprot:m.63243 g.63243  ORF g.63243 m.63243 type:complete len:50 (-) comp13961_c0_seq7:225-374(-)